MTSPLKCPLSARSGGGVSLLASRYSLLSLRWTQSCPRTGGVLHAKDSIQYLHASAPSHNCGGRLSRLDINHRLGFTGTPPRRPACGKTSDTDRATKCGMVAGTAEPCGCVDVGGPDSHRQLPDVFLALPQHPAGCKGLRS